MLKGRQSKNVEVRQREFPRPMSGSRIGGEAIHASDAKATEKDGKQRVKATMANRGNPFAKMLKSMDSFKPNKNPLAAIPIPTPRPDPSKPYKKPTVLTRDY